jgi:hypothetical protein
MKVKFRRSGQLTRWRVGDWVEVRSLPEILATLDENAALDVMPFMPEMIPYCGKRFQITKIAHKTCDSSGWESLRSLKDAVHLNATCDGSSHGGCQAMCSFFWKTQWLLKVDGPLYKQYNNSHSIDAVVKKYSSDKVIALHNLTCKPNENGEVVYRCQATEIKNATQRMPPSFCSHGMYPNICAILFMAM